MLDYFLRRLLLIIPTFIGATIVVFTIVQLAPGGPLEQQLQALQTGGAGVGTEGGSATGEGGAMIPKAAIEELKRYYGFDKPLWEQYLIWLGAMPREINRLKVDLDQARNIGDGVRATVSKAGSGFVVKDAETGVELSEWYVEQSPNADTGEPELFVFKKEFAGILTGYFGKSFTYQEPVSDLMLKRMKISLQFGVIAFILSYVVCVYLGIQKALAHGGTFDLLSSIVVFIAFSVPGWALGTILLVYFGGGSFWDFFPLGGFESKDFADLTFWGKFLDRAHHAVLPTIAYTIQSFATLTVLMKNSLLENLSQDYIRTAFAKGLPEKRVVWIHAMRNSIIPIASNIGAVIGIFITGSYVIELVFNIDGFGKLSFQAVLDRDYPIVFAYAVLTVLIQLVGAIISDFVLAVIDPRIRFK